VRTASGISAGGPETATGENEERATYGTGLGWCDTRNGSQWPFAQYGDL
jgi:hypothetical protein